MQRPSLLGLWLACLLTSLPHNLGASPPTPASRPISPRLPPPPPRTDPPAQSGRDQVAPTLPAPRTAPQAPSPESSDPIPVARRFWLALRDQDLLSLSAVVGFPFTWDARCRILRSFEEIQATLRQTRKPPKDLAFTDFRLLDPHQPPPAFARAVSKLWNVPFCRDPQDNQLLQQINRQTHIFVSLYILLGKRRVPTLTRLTWLRFRWQVTGFDN